MTFEQRPYVSASLQASLYRSQKSLSFNGISEWMAVLLTLGGDTFIIRRFDISSVNIWVKTAAATAPVEQIIVGRWFPFPSLPIDEGGWRMYIWDVPAAPNVSRAMVFHLSTDLFRGVWIYSQVSFPLDTWVMVTLTWDGFIAGSVAGLKMYWDGQQVATHTILDNWTTSAINSNAFSSLIWGSHFSSWWPGGAMPDDPPELGGFFEGLMDEHTFWRHELTAAEVAGLYRAGHPQSPMNVGIPGGHPVDTHFRMGEPSDGLAFFAFGRFCFPRYPVAGTNRVAIWNTLVPRVTEDVAP